MKAPDKIYLTVDKNEDWKYAMWTARCPQEQKFSELDKHEEYIRKDALLEWAKDMKHIYELPVHNHQANELCHTKADAFQIVVDKIESL